MAPPRSPLTTSGNLTELLYWAVRKRFNCQRQYFSAHEFYTIIDDLPSTSEFTKGQYFSEGGSITRLPSTLQANAAEVDNSGGNALHYVPRTTKDIHWALQYMKFMWSMWKSGWVFLKPMEWGFTFGVNFGSKQPMVCHNPTPDLMSMFHTEGPHPCPTPLVLGSGWCMLMPMSYRQSQQMAVFEHRVPHSIQSPKRSTGCDGPNIICHPGCGVWTQGALRLLLEGPEVAILGLEKWRELMTIWGWE